MQKKSKSRNHGLVLFNPYIGPLSGATTQGQTGPGRDGSKGVLCIPQSSGITGTSPSDCLVSYPGHVAVDLTPPGDWARELFVIGCKSRNHLTLYKQIVNITLNLKS